MTTPFWCVFAAFLLAYAPRLVVMYASVKQFGRIDNKKPRLQQKRLKGFGQRAQASHENALEAFAPFAAAVFVCHLAGGDLAKASVLAMGFVLCRVAYLGAYWADLDYLRTAVWYLGFFATIGLFLLPLLS